MPFYLRKSIKAGPFRFNLSKSGVGVSTGIPGFRVGTGPRGNYVSMSSHGISYRATSSAAKSTPKPQPTYPAAAQQSPVPFNQPDEIVLDDVTGESAFTLQPTGPGDVVGQLNAASKQLAWGWSAVIVLGVLGLISMPYGLIIWALAIPACWWIFQWDAARRTVVLFYDVEDESASWFDRLVTSWGQVTNSRQMWRTTQSGDLTSTYDRKVNAGANTVIRRVSVKGGIGGPKHMATNVSIPSMQAGNSHLYFLPDRVLVFDSGHYTDIGYSHLNVDTYDQQFIETGAVPSDGQRIGTTWKYVNKNGGPDGRYKDNPEIPIMMYGALELTTPQGLNWDVNTSRVGAPTDFAMTLLEAPTVNVSKDLR